MCIETAPWTGASQHKEQAQLYLGLGENERSKRSLFQMGRRSKLSSPAAAIDGASSSTMVPVKKVPALNTAYNSGMLHSIAGDWNPNIKGVFSGIGMEELCKIKDMGNNNRIFSMSMLARIDPKDMKMYMGDGNHVIVNYREVAKCLGLSPCGRKIDIPGGVYLANREGLLENLHAILDTTMSRASRIPVVKVKKIIQNASKVAIVGAEKEKMIVACTIIAASTFLLPRGAHPKIANEILPVLAEPTQISDYDFCDYVVEGLREGAAKLREDLLHDPSQLSLQGCLVIPQIIFYDYHEHGMEGRETLSFPRLASYSDLMMKLQIRKHAARHGVAAGFEAVDVPRSPVINAVCGSATQEHGWATPSSSVHAPPTGFRVDHATEIPREILDAFKEAVEHQLKQREQEFMKMVEETQVKVLVEIKSKADAKRHRDPEDTLGDFMDRVKRQAPMAAAFPNVSQTSHRPRVSTDITQDLAETSREAARALMSVVVVNEEPRGNPETSAVAGASTRVQETDINSQAAVHVSAYGKDVAVQAGVDEPMEKTMIVDHK
ncbi:uncharacterized protein [Triticum aestivum]|uniref:uncharacterized protein n=1 Tax=Triticum aestivum TaxID=4565 RepID=UPI001D00CD46|nr:uncharacterized protein LOC123101575 [Triticum aestivum]